MNARLFSALSRESQKTVRCHSLLFWLLWICSLLRKCARQGPQFLPYVGLCICGAGCLTANRSQATEKLIELPGSTPPHRRRNSSTHGCTENLMRVKEKNMEKGTGEGGLTWSFHRLRKHRYASFVQTQDPYGWRRELWGVSEVKSGRNQVRFGKIHGRKSRKRFMFSEWQIVRQEPAPPRTL